MTLHVIMQQLKIHSLTITHNRHKLCIFKLSTSCALLQLLEQQKLVLMNNVKVNVNVDLYSASSQKAPLMHLM